MRVNVEIWRDIIQSSKCTPSTYSFIILFGIVLIQVFILGYYL